MQSNLIERENYDYMLEAYKFGPLGSECMVIQIYKKVPMETTNTISKQLVYSGFVHRELWDYEVLKTFLKFGAAKKYSSMKDRVGFTDMHDRKSSSIDSVGEITVDIIRGLTIGFEPSMIEEKDYMGRIEA